MNNRLEELKRQAYQRGAAPPPSPNVNTSLNYNFTDNPHRTVVPSDTVSVFTRATFEIADVAAVHNLFLGADYDDAYVAWINGVEVYRSAQAPPSGPMAWDTAVTGHESSNASTPDYTPLVDISLAIPTLRNGTSGSDHQECDPHPTTPRCQHSRWHSRDPPRPATPCLSSRSGTRTQYRSNAGLGLR